MAAAAAALDGDDDVKFLRCVFFYNSY